VESPYEHKIVGRIKRAGTKCWEISRWFDKTTKVIWYVIEKENVFGVVYLENGKVICDDESGIIPKFAVSYCEKLLRKKRWF
jgi:hypothetical protein